MTEANSSFRPYRPAHGIEAALERLNQQKGVKYDADVVTACLALFAEGNFSFAYDGENGDPLI